jgi:hypothetical protein
MIMHLIFVRRMKPTLSQQILMYVGATLPLVAAFYKALGLPSYSFDVLILAAAACLFVASWILRPRIVDWGAHIPKAINAL